MNPTHELQSRHPVVVIMGHIDHGKTTLLDYIRKAHIVAGESGGITQHMGFYETGWNGKHVTFLDTPGHETFSKMRARGARVADIAILVVAADDGVKPQTKEALGAIDEAKIPYVVALNKIDKPTADPDRVKSELAASGVLLEGWGGTIPCVLISAKEGKNIGELLETIFLLAELEGLTTDPTKPASGVVIESHLDSRRGPAAVLLITNGSLRKGMFVSAGGAQAPVRILENSDGDAIDIAEASSPVSIIGFNAVPPVGAEFRAYSSKDEMEQDSKETPITRAQDNGAEIGIMIKADVAGSLEALTDEMRKIIPANLPVKFFAGSVGDITESDIKIISSAKKGFIIGFRTKAKTNVEELAFRFGLTVKTFDIIYEALDWVAKELAGLVPKKLVREDAGKLIVLKVFSASSAGRIVGGRVREGRVPKDAVFEVIRNSEVVARGSIIGLQHNKKAVEQLREGEEGGLLVHSGKAIEERDILQFFYERET